MPRNTTPSGETVYIPGVYSAIEVVSDLPGALPDFQVPMVLGGAEEGYPYNVADSMYGHETLRWWQNLGTATAARAWFGADSDLGIGMAYAKRHGLPRAYCVCLSALTRASVLVTSLGLINQFYLAPRKYGAPGGHMLVKHVTGALEITPLKHFSRLVADGGIGQTRIYVRDNSWIREGMSLVIGDNDTADAAYTVDSLGTSLDSNGQVLHWVDLTSALVADITTVQYGMVLEHDTAKIEAPATFADGQALVTWLQDHSEYMTALPHASFSGAFPLDVVTATALKDIGLWGVVVDGTSPAPISSDYDGFLTALDASDWDAFAEIEQVIPRALLVLESSSTVHQAFRDWATAKRVEGQPVSVTVGCAWDDIDLAAVDDTNPVVRAGALDNQDVLLCAGGLDRLGACLSLAPAVFGLRVGGGIPHNLTSDRLIYGEVETKWDERNSGHLTSLHKGGVCTYRLSSSAPYRWVVSQGLSTLQANANSWNESTADTPLVMQRDLADYVNRIIVEDLDTSQLGADRVTAATLGAVIHRRAEKSLLRRGLIEAFKITSITLNDSATGWDVAWSIKLPTTTDFINLTTTVLIGE